MDKPGSSLFVNIEFRFEIDTSGKVTPYYSFDCVPADQYSTGLHMFRLALEVVLLCFLALYIAKAVKGLWVAWKAGKVEFLKEVTNLGNILEYVKLTMMVIVVAMWLLITLDPSLAAMESRATSVGTEYLVAKYPTTIYTGGSNVSCPPNVNNCTCNYDGADSTCSGFVEDSINLISVSVFVQIYYVMVSVCCLLMCVKFLGFMDFSPQLSLLTATLSKAGGALCEFGTIFAVLLGGFMLSGYILFSYRLIGFSTAWWSLETCFELILGNGDFYELYRANRIGAYLFYYPFVFIMVFVVLNMTIAIIMDAFAAIQQVRKDTPAALAKTSLVKQLAFGAIRQMACLKHMAKGRKLLPRFVEDRFSGPTKGRALALLAPVADVEETTFGVGF